LHHFLWGEGRVASKKIGGEFIFCQIYIWVLKKNFGSYCFWQNVLLGQKKLFLSKIIFGKKNVFAKKGILFLVRFIFWWVKKYIWLTTF
jgi:hypothetical protein